MSDLPAIVTDNTSVIPSLDQIQRLQNAIAAELDCYNIDELTTHHFCEGMYARELFIPAGTVVVGKMHAKENFFVLMSGEVTVLTPSGVKRVKAPFMVVTKPGDKRIAYAHEDSVTFNFHPNENDETDVALLESKYIVPGDKELLWHEDAKLIESCLMRAAEESL